MAKPEFITRNYRPADFESLAQLSARQSRSFGQIEAPQAFAERLKRPGLTPENDIFIAETGGMVVGYAQITVEAAINRVHLRGWIDAPHRRQGLAGRLLELVTARTCKLGITSIQTGMFQENRVAREALPKLGFRYIRRYLDMEMDIDTLPIDRFEQSGKNCRQLQTGEEESLMALQNRAFTGHWGYQPYDLDTFLYDINLNNRSWQDIIVYPEKNKIISYCWTEIYEISTVHGFEKRGLVNMLGTEPEFRSRRIGRLVLTAGLSHLKNNGVKKACLSVDAVNRTAFELYRSLGFTEFGSTLWYEKKVGQDTGIL